MFQIKDRKKISKVFRFALPTHTITYARYVYKTARPRRLLNRWIVFQFAMHNMFSNNRGSILCTVHTVSLTMKANLKIRYNWQPSKTFSLNTHTHAHTLRDTRCVRKKEKKPEARQAFSFRALSFMVRTRGIDLW